MKSKEQVQKDINILIDLISKSSMTARQKDLSLDKIKSIIDYATLKDVEINKLAVRKFGFKTSEELETHFDRLKAYSEIMGVHDIDLTILNPWTYNFIMSNYGYIRQPINNISLQQLCYALKLYHTFTNEYPVSMYNLKDWLKENEYLEVITKLNDEVLKKLKEVNDVV